MFTGPIDRLTALVSSIDAPEFDAALFGEAGVFVVRQAIPAALVRQAIADWSDFQERVLRDRVVYRFNPVAVQEPAPAELEALFDNEAVIAVAKQVFGDAVALYSFRFVVKDRYAREAVFLHNDVGYHSGRGVNASFFIPLSECSADNGAMSFYPGTHMLGYLGDVGELDAAALQPGWPKYTPNLAPGDLVVMSSALWHESGAHTAGPDRVLADVILKSPCDPFYRRMLCGRAPQAYGVEGDAPIFKRSRVTRLIEYQAKLDELQRRGSNG